MQGQKNRKGSRGENNASRERAGVLVRIVVALCEPIYGAVEWIVSVWLDLCLYCVLVCCEAATGALTWCSSLVLFVYYVVFKSQGGEELIKRNSVLEGVVLNQKEVQFGVLKGTSYGVDLSQKEEEEKKRLRRRLTEIDQLVGEKKSSIGTVRPAFEKQEHVLSSVLGSKRIRSGRNTDPALLLSSETSGSRTSSVVEGAHRRRSLLADS
eukprot:Nk52_evm43s1485 gene=Nk52_evmTU43s1485